MFEVQTLNRAEFTARFPMTVNHLNPTAGWNRCLFATEGEELKMVTASDARFVWTCTEGNYNTVVHSGFRPELDPFAYLVGKTRPTVEDMVVEIESDVPEDDTLPRVEWSPSDFLRRFSVRPNPFTPDQTFNVGGVEVGCFKSDGRDFKYVKQQDEQRVWTLCYIEELADMWIGNGFWHDDSDKLYLLTTTPWPAELLIVVQEQHEEE